MDRMRNIMFGDQREKLAELLNLNVQVLIYHGIFDMIIPISSTIKTIENTQWRNNVKWRMTNRSPYYYTTEDGIKELMGNDFK